MTKLKFIFTGLFLIFATLASNSQDISEQAKVAIRNGNSKALSDLFTSNIDLSIDSEGADDVYSKSQAEQILKKFFERNKPTGFTIIHEGKSRQDIEYKIGELETSTGKFRVTINMKSVSGKMHIHQLRIE